MRRTSASIAACVVAALGSGLMAQAPPDVSKLGPAVGAVAPAFSGVDQFGRTQTLESTYGPKGVMLVFSRSADW
jgi:hypothetical protein